MAYSLQLDWWRREPPAETDPALPAVGAGPVRSRVAFKALLAFTVVLIASPQQYFPIPSEFRVAFAFAVLAILAHVLDVLKTVRATKVPIEFKVVLVLVGWAVAGVPTSMWPGGSFQVLTDQYLKSVAVFWLLGSVICSIDRFRVLLWTLAATTVPVALSGVRAFLSGSFADGRIVIKVSGLSSNLASNPNDLALLLCLFLPLTGVLALTAKRRLARTLAWGVFSLSIAGIIVTFSRAGLLVLVTEGALFSLVLWRRRSRKALTALVLGALVLVIAFPTGLSQRFASTFGDEQDPSAQLRQGDQGVAVWYILAHPIVGAGIGSDLLAMDDQRTLAASTHVHNVYLAYGVDLGIPGLALFLLILLAGYRGVKQVERSQISRGSELGAFARAVRISLVGFMVAGFFAPVAYHFHFYYLAGLAVALKEIAKEQAADRVGDLGT